MPKNVVQFFYPLSLIRDLARLFFLPFDWIRRNLIICRVAQLILSPIERQDTRISIALYPEILVVLTVIA